MRSATSTFSGHPSSVPAARRWVVGTLADWGLEATSWTAAQIVSELATNCTLHARSEFTVRVLHDTACLRVETDDHSPLPLQSRAYSATSTTGRGLGIVDVLSVEWGVIARTDGKTVWALLSVDAADVGSTDDDDDVAGSTASGPGRGGRPTGTGVTVRGGGEAA